MKLSESIQRNIMQPFVGGLINKFKVKGRRDVLFFEEILANYIRECEKAGHGKEMEDIGRKCTTLVTDVLSPKVVRKVPITSFFNKLARKMWINLTGRCENLLIRSESVQYITATVTELNRNLQHEWGGVCRDDGWMAEILCATQASDIYIERAWFSPQEDEENAEWVENAKARLERWQKELNNGEDD